MNICIDMRPALSRPTGVGVYLQNMVKHLSEIDEQNRYLLFSSSWKDRFPRTVHANNFEIRDYRMPVRLLNYFWNHYSMPSLESILRIPVDVVHSPTPLVVPAKRARKITTIMDLYFYFHPEDTQREIKSDYVALIQEHCKRSDAIIAISEYTKQQLVEHLKVPASRVYTIHLGTDLFYSETTTDAERSEVIKRFGISTPYFLFVGAQEPRKNLDVLLRAFRSLPPDMQLVLAGPKGWGNQEWSDLLNDRVIQTGYVSKIDLRALYQQAIALIEPSREEGFGLPLLEGMASGIPVIASHIPVFHEICGDAFLPFSNDSIEELAEAMLSIALNSELRAKLVACGKERIKKFSWRETAEKTLEIYKHL